MPLAFCDHVIELDAVRTLEIRCRLGRFFHEVETHGGCRKIGIALRLDDVVAFGKDLVINDSFHDDAPVRCSSHMGAAMRGVEHYCRWLMRTPRITASARS